MRILKNLAAIAVCTLCAWGLVLAEYSLILLTAENLLENMPFMLIISLLPAVILTVLVRMLCRKLDSGFYHYVPIAFLLAGFFQCAAPFAENDGMFHWFYQLVLCFGAFIWTILYSIKDFIFAIRKNKKLLREISEEHYKQQKLNDKGEN